jgi:DNA repair protein RecN (Recombination protein N)
VLLELRVENLLLIERAELALDPGLNVITGETGAGKTVLAHAFDMLLGGKPRRGVVRPGAREAYVEGVFEAPAAFASDLEVAEARERFGLEGREVVLARRVTADGRTRAYVQGRSASAADLRDIGGRLVAFYGQHEHRRLTLASAQLDALDVFCGKPQLDARARFAAGFAEARRIHEELVEARERAGARERDLDLLEFELREIEEAAPEEREEAALEAERARLSSVESIRAAAWSALAALDPGDGASAGGVSDLMGGAGSELARARGADDRLDELADRFEGLVVETRELTRELRGYEESLQADPERLAQVEERLDLLGRLKRKHGGTITAVLEHAARCRAEHARLEGAEETTARLEAELAHTLKELEREAQSLRAARREAAAALEREVRKELSGLAMGEASFEVALAERDLDPARGPLAPYGPRGADVAEFVIAPNRGVAAAPLREIASGGELSRTMLALLGVAGAERSATVVFDEIDAGVGGKTALAVGAKLQALARKRQVICITHLPQVAALAARHFRVTKDPGRDLAVARVERVEDGQLVAELCRMLGADAADGTVRRHAERLLEAA